jgi:hypothetical protein
MMSPIALLVTALMLQQPGTDAASELQRLSERRSALSVRTLIPVGTGGSASHQDGGSPPADLNFPISHVEPSFNLSLALDLGPFNQPTHTLLTLDFNRIGFAVQEPGQGSKVLRGDKGEWKSVELLAGMDWLSEGRTRVGGALSFGAHWVAYTLIDPTIHDADVSASAASLGFRFYVDHPLGSGFRIGGELRAAFMPNWNSNGGLFATDEVQNHGHTFFITASASWEPVKGLVLHAGYAVWNGVFDQEKTALFSTSSVTNNVDLKAHGPLIGIEWDF